MPSCNPLCDMGAFDPGTRETGVVDAKSIRPVSGYLTVYVALFVLGRMAVLEGTGLALFWPAAGIAALWMLRGTTARQVAVDASLLLATGVALYLLLGIGPAPALLLSWANLIQGLVVRAFLAYTGGRRLLGPQPTALSTVRDLMYLGAGSVVAALASAPFGAAAAYLNTGVRSRELVLVVAGAQRLRHLRGRGGCARGVRRPADPTRGGTRALQRPDRGAATPRAARAGDRRTALHAGHAARLHAPGSSSR